MSEIGYIYTLNCPITGSPRYVGQTIRNPKQRMSGHLNCKKINKRTTWIKSLLLNGLSPVMEIIDLVNVSEINFWEKHYISLYNSWGFDLKNGTFGGEFGGRPTMEARQKMRQAKLGKKQSDDTKLKRSLAMIGNKNGLGYKKTEEQKLRSKQNKKKFKHTNESKLKMSQASKGVPKSEEHKQKLRGKRKIK